MIFTISGVTLTMITIWRAPADIFGAPTKILLSPKTKKVATFFGDPLWAFCPPPYKLFVPPHIFPPPPNVKLANVWLIFAAKYL